VFVSDPSAEAERIALALRTVGYTVVDVPLTMLLARASVQRPRLVLVDADAEGAMECVQRLRELPDADDVEVIFLGHAGQTLAGPEDALLHEGSGFFDRPVNISSLIRAVDDLTGGVSHGAPAGESTPPSSLPPRGIQGPTSRTGSAGGDSSASVPNAVSERANVEQPLSSSSLQATRRTLSIQTPLSLELEALLAAAEERIGTQLRLDDHVPTPEEEIEAVLPPEILASLDEPLEEEDVLGGRFSEDRARAPLETGPPVSAPSPGEPALAAETHGGYLAQTTGNRGLATSEAGPHPPPVPHEPPPAVSPAEPSTLGSLALQADAVAVGATARDAHDPRARGTRMSRKAESVPAPNASVLAPSATPTEADVPLVLARAIASRATGTLCMASEEGVRRAVLREGDLVTAASDVDAESLLAFLGGRGDLPRERVERLTGKIPPFGRHAGAALVAHGHLRQDQLWPVLRAHSEWILGKAILVGSGTIEIEAEPPGRLRSEPSVFGGSTGAEVMVEVVRRVIAPEDAIARLGGRGGRVGDGAHSGLLSECALDPAERDVLGRMRGATVGAILEAAPNTDFASVVYAIHLLGVVDIVRSVDDARADTASEEAHIEALDEDAIRERVRARLEIVDEGDYFAVLGVSPDATGYEIRRALLDLRRAFEPTRVLTPRSLDLADDVRKIASALEEAYEVLSDSARRERYRRAIFTAPEG
jgi:DNA-binding response OmpR family regulator